jgi:uncharacterized membrane protein
VAQNRCRDHHLATFLRHSAAVGVLTVGASARAIPQVTARRRVAVAVPYVVGLLFAAAYATLSLARLHRLETRSWDVAIFEQAIRGYASLGWPIVDVKGPGYNLLGDHFSPLLAVFAPFYRLFPGPGTLLIGQALLIGLSVAVITRTAVRHLGAAAGLAVGVAYGLSWGIQSAVNFDFHEVCLAVPLLALAGEAYLERRWGRVAVWAALLLLVKEDMGVTVAALGVCLLVAGARRWGAALFIGGAVAFAVTVFVVVPAFNPDGTYDYWAKFGSEDGGTPLLERLLSLPVQMVTPATKLETVLLALAVTGAIALWSPFALLALPTLGWRFLGDNPYYWGTDWHYSLTLMPILFVALVDGVVRARRSRWPWLRSYAGHVPAVALAVALVLCLQFPLRDLLRPETYAESPRAEAAAEVLSLVPAGASVETDIGLMTQLAGDRTVYWIGNDNAGVTPDYVLIDTAAGWSVAPRNAGRLAEQRHPGARYREVFDSDGYLLAQRVE